MIEVLTTEAVVANPNKYLWCAIYNDGTQLSQLEYDEDRSKDPIAGAEGRSAYWDVDHSKLEAFMVTDTHHEYAVELKTGHFLIDGIIFRMHSAEEGLSNFQLVWMKRTYQFLVAREDGSTQELSRTVFRLGWRCVDPHLIRYNGEPVIIERVMELD